MARKQTTLHLLPEVIEQAQRVGWPREMTQSATFEEAIRIGLEFMESGFTITKLPERGPIAKRRNHKSGCDKSDGCDSE